MNRSFDKSILVFDDKHDTGLGLPYDAEEGVIISDEIIDTSRWSVIHYIIFKFEDKFYGTSYSVGATEQQDEYPWEFEDPIHCEELVPIQKTITVYKPVKE
jgi:hypothetical protein